ncbi:MAG: hypothetical protein Hyperionvirus1_178 [Hyperionvirus sp.]|uniref:Uncharacterized protein n=1 Tax=Hyperionvirus sp. TaxID=2487770 RepID=A0A3G5ABB1_9VIRU|nr:MAG: hypothetical protein Hyperionvirus1_178 [Hyperionvirus sp.]
MAAAIDVKKGRRVLVPYNEVYSLQLESIILSQQFDELNWLAYGTVDQERFRRMGLFVEQGIVTLMRAKGPHSRKVRKDFRCPPCAKDFVEGKPLAERKALMSVKTEKHERKMEAYRIMIDKLNVLRGVIRERFEKISDSLKPGFCDPILEMKIGDYFWTLNPRTGKLDKLPWRITIGIENYWLVVKLDEFLCSSISIPMAAEDIRRGCTDKKCVYNRGKFSIFDYGSGQLTKDGGVIMCCMKVREFKLSSISEDTPVVMCSLGDNRIFIMYGQPGGVSRALCVDSLTFLEVDKPLHIIPSDIVTFGFKYDRTVSLRLIPFSEGEKVDVMKKLEEMMSLVPIVIVRICVDYLVL